MANSRNPQVSVVIPFYDCPYLDRAIESCLAQTGVESEIVVVDDGSTRHLDKLAPYRHRIVYVRKDNGGTASALNAGIRRARGEYIAWLSSDDVMMPGKLARQSAFMRAHQALISCTDFHFINAAGAVTHLNQSERFPTARAFIESLLYFCPINGSTVMMHRTLPDRIGYFDESLSCAQDYDYWIRVHLARIDLHFIPEPWTLYRHHEGMGTVTRRELAAMEFNVVRERHLIALHTLVNMLPL